MTKLTFSKHVYISTPILHTYTFQVSKLKLHVKCSQFSQIYHDLYRIILDDTTDTGRGHFTFSARLLVTAASMDEWFFESHFRAFSC